MCVRIQSANMTPQIFFSQHFDMCIKNAEFDADFKSVGKSSKKIHAKAVISINICNCAYFTVWCKMISKTNM